MRRKVCLLGAYAVGKTSLVRRFVTSLFSDRYLTTVGVKVDRKEIALQGRSLMLLLWDLHGEDEFQRVHEAYIRGAAGYLLVLDPTRPATLVTAYELAQRARSTIGEAPHVILMNKADISSEWEIEEPDVRQVFGEQAIILCTSAKTGVGVEHAFHVLGQALVQTADGQAG